MDFYIKFYINKCSAVTQFFGTDAQIFTYFAYTEGGSADTQFSEAVLPFFVWALISTDFLTNFLVEMLHIMYSISIVNNARFSRKTDIVVMLCGNKLI